MLWSPVERLNICFLTEFFGENIVKGPGEDHEQAQTEAENLLEKELWSGSRLQASVEGAVQTSTL